jgi:hypothetical protein
MLKSTEWLMICDRHKDTSNLQASTWDGQLMFYVWKSKTNNVDHQPNKMYLQRSMTRQRFLRLVAINKATNNSRISLHVCIWGPKATDRMFQKIGGAIFALSHYYSECTRLKPNIVTEQIECVSWNYALKQKKIKIKQLAHWDLWVKSERMKFVNTLKQHDTWQCPTYPSINATNLEHRCLLKHDVSEILKTRPQMKK